MYQFGRPGCKETERRGDWMESVWFPCLLVSSSPCLRWMSVCAILLLTGCPRTEQSKPEAPAETPRASVTLRVLVVNEPAVAEAINRLRGEWAERSGGQLSASVADWKEVAGAKNLDADVVIFPSRYLGELCTRGWLQPVRTSVLEGDTFDASDVFPLVRRELMRWGNETMALPMGIQVVRPGEANPSHPGLSLLALAAPNAVVNEREGVLFDPQTMKPRIADPVFVEALEWLGKDEQSKQPGRENPKTIPVLGFSDRMIAVASASRNGASAFQLIAWLASPEISTQLASASEPITAARKSLASSPAWMGRAERSAEGADLGKTQDLLNAEQCLLVPRIPGIDEYIAVLDEAVRRALKDKTGAEEILKKVADAWDQITNARGREVQRTAYLKHLGIE